MRPLIVSFLAITLFTACMQTIQQGSGNMRTLTPHIDKFSKISYGHGIKATIKYGDTQKLTITGDDNLIDELDISVSNEVLKVGFDRKMILRPGNRIELQIETPVLTGASLSGGSSIDMLDQFDTDKNIDIDMSGGSSGRLKISGSMVNINMSGGSNATIFSKGNSLALSMSGASVVDDAELKFSQAVINLSGGSELNTERTEIGTVTAALSGGSSANLEVLQRLELNASAGSQFYLGKSDPQITQNLSGGSKIVRD